MEHEGEVCDTTLSLGLGDYVPKKDQKNNKRASTLYLSLPLQSKDEDTIDHVKNEGSGPGSGLSSKVMEEDEKQASKDSVDISYGGKVDEDNNYGIRKKLRLTIEQTTLLEDSFKKHTTLNTVQKQALAQKLKLKPRQVEVWFQNRRARTKLKQTEIDCEFLKKNCKRLNEENQRLKKELMELKSSVKMESSPSPPPFFIQIPKKAAAYTVCQSCDKVGKARGSAAGSGKQEAAQPLLEWSTNPKA